jgi:hypothetical protein
MSATKANHFQRSSVHPIVCPMCGHRLPVPEDQLDPLIGKLPCGLRCIECKQLIAGKPLSFGGGFACEPCVIAYYQTHDAEVLAREVWERRIDAARLLKQRQKA